jgi:hypothetical protein
MSDQTPVAGLVETLRKEAQDIRIFARHETPTEQRRLHATADTRVEVADRLEAALRADEGRASDTLISTIHYERGQKRIERHPTRKDQDDDPA